MQLCWWCGQDVMTPPPVQIGTRAFAGAATLMADYFLPMAERAYGDAATSERERGAATLSRWIFAERPTELYVRHVQRNVRLPGLRTAEQIKRAADALVEADMLHPPTPGAAFMPRRRDSCAINPRLWQAAGGAPGAGTSPG